MTDPKAKNRARYMLLALCAGAAFYSVASRLSTGDRGAVDYTMLSLLGMGVLWNVVQLSRRMYRHGGGRRLWHVQRTVLFWVIGLLNTVMLRPDQHGTWRLWSGCLFLVLAVCDSVALIVREERLLRESAAGR